MKRNVMRSITLVTIAMTRAKIVVIIVIMILKK